MRFTTPLANRAPWNETAWPVCETCDGQGWVDVMEYRDVHGDVFPYPQPRISVDCPDCKDLIHTGGKR